MPTRALSTYLGPWWVRSIVLYLAGFLIIGALGTILPRGPLQSAVGLTGIFLPGIIAWIGDIRTSYQALILVLLSTVLGAFFLILPQLLDQLDEPGYVVVDHFLRMIARTALFNAVVIYIAAWLNSRYRTK